MAVHFSLDGTPNRFEPPIGFAISMSIAIGIMAAVFMGASMLLAVCATRMPTLVNIPNRDHWLNKENRPATIRRVRSFLEMSGFGTMLFVLFLQWEIFQANQVVPPLLRDYLLYAAGILVAYIIFDQIRLYRSFCLPKEQ